MPVTLSIPLLQKHRVCSAGQVNFRRKFTREKTWDTLEAFEAALVQHYELWDWDEARQKFNLDEDAFENMKGGLLNHDDEEDSDWNDRSAGAASFARLYWEKVNAAADISVPSAARRYLEAVEALENTRKLKTKVSRGNLPTVSVDLSDYYSDLDKQFKRWLGDQITDNLKPWIDSCILYHEGEVDRRQKELEEALAAKRTPAATLVAAA